MKSWKAYIMVWGLMLGATSCVFEEHVPEPVVADAEMRLSVSINAGTRAGDPGADHGEWNADWATLGVYVVYTNGRVLSFSIPKAEFSSPKNFSVVEGTARIYAVAFPAGQTPPICNTVAEVQNMRTLNIANIADNADKQNYIQNIFSGISENEVTIIKNQENTASVTCTRLAAKIDVQWDAQGAYADGKYTDVAMSAITLDGLAQGYIFPSEVTNPSYSTTVNVATFTAGDQISERNGRTYFYTFPGVASAINFSVTYAKGTSGTLDGKQDYKAVFPKEIEPNTWYKVNINVSGTKASVTEGWILGQ